MGYPQQNWFPPHPPFWVFSPFHKGDDKQRRLQRLVGQCFTLSYPTSYLPYYYPLTYTLVPSLSGAVSTCDFDRPKFKQIIKNPFNLHLLFLLNHLAAQFQFQFPPPTFKHVPFHFHSIHSFSTDFFAGKHVRSIPFFSPYSLFFAPLGRAAVTPHHPVNHTTPTTSTYLKTVRSDF